MRLQPLPPETAPRKWQPPHGVEVSRLQVLSPDMRRIMQTGTELQGFEINDPASYKKLIFPELTRPLPASR